MTQATEILTPAAMKLRQLDRCARIQPFQAGDDDLLCGNDMIPILPTVSGLVHDPDAVRRLRSMAEAGQ